MEYEQVEMNDCGSSMGSDLSEPLIHESRTEPAQAGTKPARRVSRLKLFGTLLSVACTIAGLVVAWDFFFGQAVLTERGDAYTPVFYLGNGCFWERQYAYVNLERDAEGPFGRADTNVTSVVGYAGGTQVGPDNRVCYHYHFNEGDLYETLGHAEVVGIALDEDHARKEAQWVALLRNFFASFTVTKRGRERPDPGDKGAPYRSVIGLPHGRSSPLYQHVVNEAAAVGMNLLHGDGDDDDIFNAVWVYNSTMLPFYRGEQYHQFHSNFFGPSYPSWYRKDLFETQKRLGRIPPTGCPEGSHA